MKSLYFVWTTGSSGTDTFVPCLCPCALHMHVYRCVLVSPVFVCVCMSPVPSWHGDEGKRTWDVYKWVEEAGDVHRLGETGPRICAVPLPGQEWAKDGLWQLWVVSPQICNYLRRQRHAHNFCCAVACVCICKRGWRVCRVTQHKSSGMGF